VKSVEPVLTLNPPNKLSTAKFHVYFNV